MKKVPLFLLLLSFCGPVFVPAAAAKGEMDKWLEHRQKHEERRRTSFLEAERKALLALEKARNALELARKSGGGRAEDIAGEALSTANQALEKLRNNENTRLEARTLVERSAKEAGKGNWKKALRLLERAEKLRPGDMGIKKAKGYVLYLRDREGGKKVFNPKAEILLDALEFGRGDWERSISYLEDAIALDPRCDPCRDALNSVKGVYAQVKHEEYVAFMKSLGPPVDEAAKELTGKGMELIDQKEYCGAARCFREAHELSPRDLNIRDVMNFTEGLCFAGK